MKPQRLLLCLTILLGLSRALAEPPERIVVGGGDRFEPLMFRNAAGEPDGLWVDSWQLWSEKTGTAVEFRLMPWNQAIPALLAGDVDAVHGVSHTPTRAEVLDFTEPQMEGAIRIYFRQTLGGVRGLDDLSGFPVGVIGGSHVADYVRETAPDVRPVPYPNYEAMVHAARTGRIHVFLGEDPIVPFFFTKSGGGAQFRRTEEPLLSNDMRVAVRKGDAELLELVQRGFAAITPAEQKEIEDAWGGGPVGIVFPWRLLGIVGAVLLVVLALLTLWNTQLRRRVAVATASLRESEERYRAVVEDQADLVCRFLADGTITLVNDAYCRYFERDKDELTGSRFLPLIPEEDREQVMRHFAALGPETPVLVHEHRVVDPRGRIRWQQWTNRAVFDKDGQVIEFQGTGRDVTDRKLAEIALHESETRYRTLFESARDGILILEGERHIDCNQAAIDMFGGDREQLLANTAYDLSPPKQPDGGSSKGAMLAHIEAASRGEPQFFEWRYSLCGGDTFDAEVSLGRVVLGGQDRLLATVRDVSTRKEAVDALRESEERLSLLFTHAPDGYYLCDMKGTFLDGNRAAEELVGSGKNALIGKNILRSGLLAPRDVSRAASLLAKSVSGKPTGPDEFDLRRKDGSSVRVEVRTHVVKIHGKRVVLGIARDTTERRRAEDERRKAQALLEAAVAQSPSGVLIADAPDVTIRMANQAAFSIRGGQPGLLTGIDVAQHAARWQTFRPDGTPYPSEQLPLSRAVLEGAITIDEEVIIRDETGTDHRVSVNAAPIRDPSGQVTAGIVVFHDITEKVKLEEQLRQAQKMESVGRLAGGVAHDFNNLLMGIMSYVELCRGAVELDHPIRGWLDEITNDAQRSADLTRQLLAFARKQAIQPVPLDLNDAVAGMLNMLRRLIGEDIELIWKPGPGPSTIMMDPSQLDQILANLSVNARDAIAGVGRLTIETTAAVFDEASCAAIPGATPGEYAVLAVSDNGQGMGRDTLEHIFEPFFTTKESGKGTGLGLATVYGIARQNQGFVEVTSEVGKGTTFRICLPVCTGEADVSPVAVTQADCPHGSETVLVVEDEKSVRVTVEAFLEKLGYTVLVAETPGEAMALVGSGENEVDLLISDVVMPGMNGRDLAAKLAEHRPGLRCMFMSGYTADVIEESGALERGCDLLVKPFSREQLAAHVRKVLDSG